MWKFFHFSVVPEDDAHKTVSTASIHSWKFIVKFLEVLLELLRVGLLPNFPPVISRVRRLFCPSWGVLFVVVVSCSYQFFRPALTL